MHSVSVYLWMNVLKQAGLFGFALQRFNLHAQLLVFLHFELEKMYGDARLFFDPARGKQVGVRELVVAVAKIIDFQAAFFDQRVQTEIDFAQTDTQAFCQISLRKAGVMFQSLEQTVAGSVVEH